MPSTALSSYYSSLATDPLRGFRFTASFVPTGADGVPFDGRITDAPALPSNGISTGWMGGFTNISGLAINNQAIQYREGGYNTTVHQVPGMTTFTPLTFTRGVLYGNDQAMTWLRGIFAVAQGSGLNGASQSGNGYSTQNFRVNITISVNAHPNTDAIKKEIPQLNFKVHNAWITGLNYSDLDATNGAILFETAQIVHEGISPYFVNPATGKPVGTISEANY